MSLVEKAYLGSLIKEDFLIKDTIIKPHQLEGARHQELLRTLLELSKSGKRIDLIILTTIPKLEALGGMSYLSELLSFADIERFSDYEESILEEWKEREKRNILTLATLNDWGIEKVIAELDKINELRSNDHTSITEAMELISNAPWQHSEPVKGASTGIEELNIMLNGWQNGEVTILAARPSMGKTDCLIHFGKEAGWDGYLPLVFSLEMPLKSISSRLIASTGKFNRTKMRNPSALLSEEQKEKWPNVLKKLDETYIQIYDGPGQSVSEMRSKARKMINQYPYKKPIIFIDYLTLIKPSEVYGGNAHLQITEISKSLKIMARELDCPVICLAQLNRSVETRQQKRPMMSDIRESGSVEQDADVIIFLYRERYYDNQSDDDSLELIISKNRNGPVGSVKVKYNEYTGTIEG